MKPPVSEEQTANLKNVLLVEDDAIVRQVALAMLKRAGCCVTIAKNGQEALALRDQPWHLVLMDCHMPILDGREATRQWRSEEAGHTPIVALTGETENVEHDLCFAAGMDDVLSKPLTAAKLQQVLGRWTENQADVPEKSAVEKPREAKLLEEYRGYEDILRCMIETFIASLPAELETLMNSYEDAPKVAIVAHKLRGQALSFYACAMAQAAANLQEQAQEGHVTGELISALKYEAQHTALHLRSLLPQLRVA